jgi:phage gp29-like protein
MIKFCNSEISKVILSQTLTSDVSTGSYAASKTHNEIRKDVIKKDVKLIEKTMNRIIRMFYEVNKKAFMDLNTLPEFSLVINE